MTALHIIPIYNTYFGRNVRQGKDFCISFYVLTGDARPRFLNLIQYALTGDARPRFFESLRFARGEGVARAKR